MLTIALTLYALPALALVSTDELAPVSITVQPGIAGSTTTLRTHGGPVAPAQRLLAVALTPAPLQIPDWFPLDQLQAQASQSLLVVPVEQALDVWVPNKWLGSTLYVRVVVQDADLPGGAVASPIETITFAPFPNLTFTPTGPGQNLTDGITVELADHAAVARSREPLTFGIPIPEFEALKDLDSLELVDASGLPFPAAFSVATRWGNVGDTTAAVQWLHVKTNVDLAAGASRELSVRRRPGAPLDIIIPQASLTQLVDRLVVDTGLARFEVDLAAFDLFREVHIDRNMNGTFEPDERLVAPHADRGAWITDDFGVAYGTRHGQTTVEIEEHSPAFTRLAFRSEHRAAAGTGGIGRDFLRTTTRMTFVYGSADVRIAHTVRNDYLANPLGPVSFDDYTLALGLDEASTVTGHLGGQGSANSSVLPHLRKVVLFQDSSGGPSWDAPVHPDVDFKGYQHLDVIGEGTPAVADTGDRAEGFGTVSTANGSLTVAVRHFWQSFPKALTLDDVGGVSLGVWPGGHDHNYWMDDFSRKTTRFLASYATGAVSSNAARSKWMAFEMPIMPVLDPDQVRDARAWGDTGDLAETPDLPVQYPGLADSYRQTILNMRDVTDDWGWTVHGESWSMMNTHTTGSPRNRLTYFDRWVQTGERAFFETSEEFALHSMDLRPYHIEGFKAYEYPGAYLFEGVPYNLPNNLKTQFHDLGRAAVLQASHPYAAYRQDIPLTWSGLPATNDNINGFDYQHHMADDLYEYYLLTGEPLALSALEHMGQALLTYKSVKGPIGGTSPTDDDLAAARGFGWTLRSMVRIYSVTGETDVWDGMRQLVENLDANRGPYAVTGESRDGWYVDHKPKSNILGGQAWYESPWMMGPALMGLSSYRTIGGDPTLIDPIMKAGADYLVDHAWKGPLLSFAKALDVADPDVWQADPDPNGLPRWIPSALAAAYRVHPRPEYLDVGMEVLAAAQALTDNHFTITHPSWHWWSTFLPVAVEAGLDPYPDTP